jgi:2-polyprenyl-3-methyl-5-hydroxy-6-metoxy-1,4-benzoquinol methylase
MAKPDEKAYPDRMASVLGITQEEVRRHLLNKPFGDPLRGRYLIDFGQILSLLPSAPARVLDLGCGSGWTSRFLAHCGYEVVGLDISETMIDCAREQCADLTNVTFLAFDYEQPVALGEFDAVLFYDALHHAENEKAAINTAFHALKAGGLLVTAEPGKGHAEAPGAVEAVTRFGVTERDMEYARQRAHMLACGFSQVRDYIRVAEIPMFDLEPDAGAKQREYLQAVLHHTLTEGFTSIVVAVK